MNPLVSAVVIAFFFGSSLVTAQANYSVMYLSPGFMSKAVNTLVLVDLNQTFGQFSFSHAGEPMPLANDCFVVIEGNMQYEVPPNLLGIDIVPISKSAVEVIVLGVSSLQLTEQTFHVNCTLQGVFGAPLVLSRTGAVRYGIDFSGQNLTFNVDLAVTPNVTLLSPRLASPVVVTPEYRYDGERADFADGYALDMYVANYFQVAVAEYIVSTLTQGFLTPATHFVELFWNAANSALSVTPNDVCGTGFDPSLGPVLQIYMQTPGECGAPTHVNVSTADLAKYDGMLLFLADPFSPPPPSPSDQQVAEKQRRHHHQHHLRSGHTFPCFPLNQSECPPSQPLLVSNPTLPTNLTFPDCLACYPDGGMYVALYFSADYVVV